MNLPNYYSLVIQSDKDDEVPVKIELTQLKKAALILRALNHKLRQQILRLLDDKKRLTVTDIFVTLRLEQSVASQHLAILRRSGFVKTEREGKFVYYKIDVDRLAEISRYITDIAK